jgi:Na+/glutamate symporter
MSKTIFRKTDREVDCDERDGQIHRRAKLFGWTGCGLGMVATAMICYFAVGPMGSFPPLALHVIPLVGAAIYMIVASVAALIQYGWTNKGEKS